MGAMPQRALDGGAGKPDVGRLAAALGRVMREARRRGVDASAPGGTRLAHDHQLPQRLALFLTLAVVLDLREACVGVGARAPGGATRRFHRLIGGACPCRCEAVCPSLARPGGHRQLFGWI
jgi:chloramphenicol 3-O-phosphotransferase